MKLRTFPRPCPTPPGGPRKSKFRFASRETARGLNLSPSWVDRLARHGFEAVHWSTIGAATAPDSDILTWASEHGFVLITNDLDFSSILAAGGEATPSVVQIRTQDLLSDAVVNTLAHTLEAHRDHIERGALLSIDEAATRVRMLPLRRSKAPPSAS